MPRKGENIYKRKDGRWEGRYIKSRSVSGKAVYGYVYSRTYRDVKKALLQAAASSNLSVPCGTRAQYAPTLKDLALDYLEDSKNHVKESTRNKYINLFSSYLLPMLGELRVEDLTYEILQKHCSNLLSNGGARHQGLSPKTVSDLLSLLGGALQYAEKRGCRLQCNVKSIRIKQAEHQMRILTQSEQDALCSYLCENPTPCHLGILLSFFTGLRIGEICALRWDDISLTHQTVSIHQAMQRIQRQDPSGSKTRVVITTPKSACSIRVIPIPDAVSELLRVHTKERKGFVLTNGEAYLEPRTLENRYKRILKICEIEPANYHALRHTFATRCIEQGFDIKTLSEILGHASVTITMNRYVHPSMALKREYMQRLSAFIAVK